MNRSPIGVGITQNLSSPVVSATDGHKPLICLGEALVDLICPEPVADPADACSFEVHFGGALSNVAVAARRAGAPVALASGCGDDRWGRFLRARLRAEGVDLRFYGVVEGVPTPFAFAFLDESREPTFEIHGEGIDAAIASLAGRETEIAESAAAIVFGSNTLVEGRSRDVTTAVCARGVELNVPVLFDPNLRPGRWNDLARARECCLPYLAMANVLKCNASEARWLLGDDEIEPGAAAEALHGLGPELVVVTAGTEAAVTRGACSVEVRPPQVDLISPLGAGDAFMGTLAAGLHRVGFDLGRAGEVLHEATEAGAHTCTHLGAFDR
jgi:sugar/nucleoside kinase (ribokinase family)